MLAILKGGASIGLAGEIISSLIIPMPFRPMVSSGNGQGPEKPIIEEGVDAEEETFTFPYPEERGEISDIVNPPVEGIAGNILHIRNKGGNNEVIRGDQNIFPYLFFGSSTKMSIRAAEPGFISLTRQPELASSYVSLLVYSGYAASNLGFSYTPSRSYEMAPLSQELIHYEEDNPLYPSKALMPMFSERVGYHAGFDYRAGVRSTIQQKLYTHPDMTQDKTNVPPISLGFDGVKYDAVPDLNLRLDIKLDYEAPKLGMSLVRSEWPVLNINIESYENEAAVSPLQEYSYKRKGLAAPAEQPGLNPFVVPKHGKAEVKYDANSGILPHSLGFDDTLLRDRFIMSLNEGVVLAEHQIIAPRTLDTYNGEGLVLPSLRNELYVLDKEQGNTSDKCFNRNPTTPSHRLGDCSLANARSGRISENANIPRHSMYHQLQTDGIFAFNRTNVSNEAKDAAMPEIRQTARRGEVKTYDKSELTYEPLKWLTLPANLGFDDILLRDRFRMRLNQPITETQKSDTTLGTLAPYKMSKVGLPSVGYRLLLSAKISNSALRNDSSLDLHFHKRGDPISPAFQFRLNIADMPEYDKAEAKYKTVKGHVIFPFNLGFDGMEQGIIPRLSDNLSLTNNEVRLGSIGYTLNSYSSNLFDIPLNNLNIAYGIARVALDPYALFDLGNRRAEPVYRNNLQLIGILAPGTEHRIETDLDSLVIANYDNRKKSSLNSSDSAGYNPILPDAELQRGASTAEMGDLSYRGVISEQNLGETVQKEKELSEERQDALEDAYSGNNPQEEVYEKSDAKPTETNKSDDSSIDYVAAAAGVTALGLVALLSFPFSLLKESDEINPKDTAEYIQKEPELKKEIHDQDYNTKKCGSGSAKDSEQEIDSMGFTKTTQLGDEVSKKLCFSGIEEKGIDYDSFSKTNETLQGSEKEGTKEFCFKEIREGDNGYINVDGIEYKSYSTFSVDHEYIRQLRDNNEKSVINIRGKNGGNLTAGYEVSNKSIIAALYAYAMDETENGGQGLTLDVRVNRYLEKYEVLDHGKLTINGVFGLDDFDSKYIVQVLKRDESGNIVERFFPRGEDGEFLSLEQELPELYKDYDIELVRLEPKGEKEWQKQEDTDLILDLINQELQRQLGGDRHAPVLSQLKDENDEPIGRVYIVDGRFEITEEDTLMKGVYNVSGNGALDRDENPSALDLRNNGLLAILDRKLQEEGLDAVYKTMPTYKNRAVLRDNEIYMREIAGLYRQLAKIHPYVPKERWSLLICEEDPFTGELSEPGYDPEKGMQFVPEIGKTYRIIVGDGSDISRAIIRINSSDYQNTEQSEKNRLEAVFA